jgi:hypothetical protein
VAIDPTNTYSGADQGEGGGTSGNIYGDTFDESANPTWAFYNNADERIGNCTPTNGTGTSRSYLKFPVASIPSHVHVTSATLTLYQVTYYTGGYGDTIDAYTIGSAWDETTLDWNTHPTNFGALVGTATASSTVNTNISFDLTLAAYNWWQLGYQVDGLALRYDNESQQCQWYASDDYGAHLPSLSVTYLQDTTAPTGSISLNGGTAEFTNTPTVRAYTGTTDDGSYIGWASDWSTVNGVSANGHTGSTWSVDSAGTNLIGDSSPCGSTACWTQTFFTANFNIGDWPTFTTMFKTDSLANFQLGVVAAGNNNERFMLTGGSTGFTGLQYSTSGSCYTTATENVSLSANTWYYGQITFPLSNAGEFRIWAVGQARPSSPTVYKEGIAMASPGLNVFLDGDNASNLHHFWLSNTDVTYRNTGSGTIGYGTALSSLSNDNSTWSCGAPASGTYCVYAHYQNWTLSSGDSKKTVYAKYVDNAGQTSTGSIYAQIILDSTPPTTSITSPAANLEARGQVVVTGTATDPPSSDNSQSGLKTVALMMDGQPAGTAIANSSNPSFMWDTTNVTPGAHTLTYQATDNAGNVGNSAPVTVYVGNTGQMPYETLASRQLPDGGHTVSVNVVNGDTLVTHTDLRACFANAMTPLPVRVPAAARICRGSAYPKGE